MTSILTGLGILLVLFAIPFGLMLAPLILGAVVAALATAEEPKLGRRAV